MPPKYSSQPLDISELLTIFSELEIDFQEEDFKRPTGDRVRFLFETFYENITGEDVDDIERPNKAILGDLTDYPGLHDTSIPLYTFYRAMRQLMASCGVFDFSITDITQPTKRKLTYQLSSLYNFIRFRETIASEYKTLADDLEAKLVSINEAEAQKRDLEEELRSLQLRNKQREAEVEPMNQRIAQLEDVVKDLADTFDGLQEKATALKASAAKMANALQTKTDEMAAISSQITRLTTRIVGPEAGKIVEQVKRLNDEVQSLEAELEGVRKDTNDMKSRKTILDNSLIEVKNLVQLLSEVEKKTAMLHQLKEGDPNSISMLNASISQLTDRVNGQAQHIKGLNENIELLKSRSTRNDKLAETEINRLNNDLAEINLTIQNVHKDAEGISLSIEALKNEKTLLTCKYNDYVKYAEEEKSRITTSIVSLIQTFSKKCDSLNNALQ